MKAKTGKTSHEKMREVQGADKRAGRTPVRLLRPDRRKQAEDARGTETRAPAHHQLHGEMMNQIGIKIVDGLAITDTSEVEILEIVREGYNEGSTAARIAYILNEKGYRNRRGNPISRQNVEHYIRTHIGRQPA